MRYRYWITLISSLLLALVFLTAGVGKLLGQSAFMLEVSSFVASPLLESIIVNWLPWVEIVIGLCLLGGVAVQIVSGAAAVLVGAFIFHNSWMISQGHAYEPCSCLGLASQLLDAELSTVGALYIDIALFILALAVYFSYQGKTFTLRPWFLKRNQKMDQRDITETEAGK
ncbi:MauE/DoxX family redox-associated membrane protein [Chloroflexota bacterium]